MTEGAAPDYAEALEAWRVWKVVRREGAYTLASVIQRTLWPAGEVLAASCLRPPRLFARFRRRHEHDAPAADCDCGIYAASLDRLAQYLAEAPCRGFAHVLGRVVLWGTVVECERGFRASKAYPASIYVPADVGRPWRVHSEDVAVDLWRYGVPIELLPSTATDAPRVLAELRAAA